MFRKVLAITALAAVAVAQNIVQVAESTPELRFLVDAVVAGGLVSALEGAGPFTVFAPVDQAFEKLPRNVVDFLFNPFNVKSLDNVLTYHVVSGAVPASALTDGEVIPTLDKESVTAHIGGGKVFINDAQVIVADVKASNGIIHLIDNVLVPSNIGLPKDDIVTTAVSVAALSTLVTAVKTAGLVEALSTPNGPYTVFAPTNDAFAKLPAGVLSYLLAHPTELADVLLYHVLDHRVYSTQIVNFLRVPTLLRGEELVFVIAGGKVLVNGNSTVLTADVQCSNGAVHVIDTVLIPTAVAARAAAFSSAASNIVQLAQSVPDLSTLVTAVVAAGLVNTLSSAGPFTVFAPTNEAFGKLPADFLAYLLGNKAALVDVLTYHVVSGAVMAAALKDGEIVPTVEGKNVTVHKFGRNVLINNAFVIAADNLASNGVVHIINEVLLPEAMAKKMY